MKILTTAPLLAVLLASTASQIHAQSNTRIGKGAGSALTTGQNNTAIGINALFQTSTGGSNVAIGNGSLLKNVKGNNNVAIGVDAGAFLKKSGNICIDNPGTKRDEGVIRIGQSGTHKNTFIAGKINGDGSRLKNVSVDAANINGVIQGSQIAPAAITAANLTSNLNLGGTTRGKFIGNLTGNATTATTASALSGAINGSQLTNGTVSSAKLGSNLTLGGTTSGTFSGNLAGNATTATSLSGAINGSQITNGTVTSNKLGSNLALGGTTTGSFSGSFTGDLDGSATDAGELDSPTMRVSVANTPTFGDAAGFDFNAGEDGLLIETAEPSESAGIFLNGNVAVIYCPGDVDLLQVRDEDSMSAIPFRVKAGGGIESKGTGTFSNGVAVAATETLRLVRGEINDNGEPLGGTGYTCVQNGTGDYTITFNSSFTSLPSPVVTCFDAGAPQIATVHNVAADSFSVKIWTIAGAAVNSVFYFQAAGPN